jgi:putative ABC transport system permease protein
MWFRILKGSFYHQRRFIALILLSTVMGASIISALLAVSTEVSGKVATELRKYGANILVEPKAGLDYLNEEDLPKIKSVFWRHNVIGFVPYLYGIAQAGPAEKSMKVVVAGTWFKKSFLLSDGSEFTTGLRAMAPGWDLKGDWASDNGDTAMVGSSLARKLGLKAGDTLRLTLREQSLEVKTAGIITSGSFEDDQVFLNLSATQKLLGTPGKVSRVMVSAVTVPMDDFGRRDPKLMSRREYDKWYCTAYAPSVARQIEEVLTGSKVRPVWRVVEAEGKILNKLKLVIGLLVAMAVVASALAVATTMMTNVLKRQDEIGLMKAIGADSAQISFLFLAEGSALGLCGGLLGYGLGFLLARYIGQSVFGAAFEVKLILLPIALLSSLGVTLLGSLIPLKRAQKVEPGLILIG